jgi:3-hydroxymyristoyl/3-hydroxydecanoyl-(acyl carrier protein) dehydratase
MEYLGSREGRVVGRVVVGSAFKGFAGHFPGSPIVPGFMQVELALELLALSRGGGAVGLVAVEEGRFLQPAFPEAPMGIELTPESDDTYIARLWMEGEGGGDALGSDGETVSRFRFRVDARGPGGRALSGEQVNKELL